MTEAAKRYMDHLLRHDWYHDMSDDWGVVKAGAAREQQLEDWAKSIPEFQKLLAHAKACRMQQAAITFPAEMLQENTKPNTTPDIPTMKEVLALIKAALIDPIIEAIDRLGKTIAYNSGNGPAPASPPASPAPAAEVEAPAPAAAPKKKAAAKPAAAPAPAPEPEQEEEEEETFTLDEVKGYAKSLADDKKKDKMRSWMQENLKVNTLAEATPDMYPAIVAALKHLGAKAPEASADL